MNYYNGGHIFNNDCYINFVVGNRTAGKSYFFKRQCLKRYLERGEQFIYLRRLQEDIKLCMPTWGDDILNRFPGVTIATKKNVIYVKRTPEDEPEICGYTTNISGIARMKSIVLSKVKTIFFDEFLPDDNRYLHPKEPLFEPEMLLSLYLTVARGFKEVIRPNVQIICAANNTSLYNPYFSFFGVDLGGAEKFKKNGVYAERVINYEAAAAIRSTHIGKVLEKSRYGAYALDNKALHDIHSHIARPTGAAVPLFSIYFNNWYTVYQDTHDLFIRQSYDPSFPRKFKLTDFETQENIPWLSGETVKALRKTAESDRLWYDSMATKSIFSGIFCPIV